MSMARDLVYSFAEDLARKAQKEGIPYNGRPIEPGGRDDDYLHGLLDQVEDDRAHAEARKLLERGEEMRRNGRPDGTATIGYVIGGALVVEALAMDPYEERDGQLVRKSDGRPVQL